MKKLTDDDKYFLEILKNKYEENNFRKEYDDLRASIYGEAFGVIVITFLIVLFCSLIIKIALSIW